MKTTQIQLAMTGQLKQMIEIENLNGDQIYKIGEKIYSFREAYKEMIRQGATHEEIIYHLFRPFDEYLQKKLVEYAKDGIAASCRIGCTHCCHYKVDVYAPEATLLLEKAIEEGIEIDWEYIKEQAKIKENLEHAQSAYSKCVFLKDNKCSVYEVRPLSCRKYHVFTDPKLCDVKTYPHGQVGVIADIESEIVVSGLGNIHNPENKGEGSMAEMLLQAKERKENNV